MDPVHRGMLAAELGLNEARTSTRSPGMMAKRDLFELAGLDFPELHDKPHRPGDHPLLGNDRRNIFHIIRENGPLLLQHPYESFATTVERFLATAAKDPKVLAIKMTLYRTSGGAILDSLIKAAQNGKQVAVLVELKARFDEAANIGWARRLEAEGIHVTYGVLGSRPTASSSSSCAGTTRSCAATTTSAPATTTAAPPSSTPTSACSAATRTSAPT
jgi:polyphosphate kinase